MSAITYFNSAYLVYSDDVIDKTLETAFPELHVSVYEMSEDILNHSVSYGLLHHNYKVVVYKSKQYVIEVKTFNGFDNKEVFICWISKPNNEGIKMAYGKKAAIRLLFEELTA